MAHASLSTFAAFYVFDLVANLVRYGLFAGGAYFVFWMWKRQRFDHRRIQSAQPRRATLQSEFLWSMSTAVIFGAIGVVIFYLRLPGNSPAYDQIADYGWPYFLASIGILLVVHDTYFYWAHRMMHHPWLFKRVHRVHHYSSNPSPWAAYAFHPIEAVIEGAFLPVLACFLPLHLGAVIIFVLMDMAFNVLGHLGYELFPAGWTRHGLRGWINSSTHHNMHHRFSNSNFGLYFNFWDWLCGTNHVRYHETFEALTSDSQRADPLNRARSAGTGEPRSSAAQNRTYR